MPEVTQHEPSRRGGSSSCTIAVLALASRVNHNEALVRRARLLDTTLLLEVGATSYLIDIRRGRIESVTQGPFVMPSWTFALRASVEEWAAFWQPVPLPGHHDLMAMVKRRALRVEGNLHPFMAHLLYFKEVLASLRPVPASVQTDVGVGSEVGGEVEIEPIIGRYLRMTLLGKPHRVYVEEAGRGIPLLCLHTAGSDSRQYRALLNDPRVLEHFRVIAFDLPWHGKSSPPAGWHNDEYRLTSDDYVAIVLGVSDALGLGRPGSQASGPEQSRPVVMGCSIGGRIVLKLVLEHAGRFRAAIGLQAGAHVDPYYDMGWLNRPDVHGEVSAAIVSGLIAPQSPDADRWETLWQYMQGGPGIFKGDLYFYKIDGDIRDRIAAIDTRQCPLYLLSGEYDYSCTPQDTLDAAARIAGAKAIIMPGLGHFPMSEDPQRFIEHLLPVLERIRAGHPPEDH